MSDSEQKRQRISDLLHAGMKPKVIKDIVGCSLATVYNVDSAIKSGKGIKRKVGSGGANLVRDDQFLGVLKTKIEEDPTISKRRLSKDMGVAKSTIDLAVKVDLGLKSYVRQQRHLLTAAAKQRRLERCKKVLNYLKARPAIVKIFSDKKIFTIDQVYNRRNDRWLGKSTEEVRGVFRTKHPQQIMMFGLVTSDGKKMPPYFFKPGEKIGTEEYYKLLRYTVLPWLKANYPKNNYVWTQDGAPSHTARKVQKFCADNFANFWPANFWPSSSPDLNPLDYSVWSVIESKANSTSHPNLDSLKAAINKHWCEMSATYIIDSCKRFRPRVEAVIEANGGHIE